MSIKSKLTANSLNKIESITGGKLTLWKFLLAIRQAEDYSQTEFASKLKISKQQLCDIEHGRKSISPKLAATYAEILGYSKEQFIRLALQDIVDREHLNVTIEVSSSFAYAMC